MNKSDRNFLYLSSMVSTSVFSVFLFYPIIFNYSSFFRSIALIQGSILAIVLSISLISLQISSQKLNSLLSVKMREDGLPNIKVIAVYIAFNLIASIYYPLLPPLLIGATLSLSSLSLFFTFYMLMKIKEETLESVHPDKIFEKVSEVSNIENSIELIDSYQSLIEAKIREEDNVMARKAIQSFEKSTIKIAKDYPQQEEILEEHHNIMHGEISTAWRSIGSTALENDRVLFQQTMKSLNNIAEELSEFGKEFYDDSHIEASNCWGFAVKRLERSCISAYEKGELDRGHITELANLTEKGARENIELLKRAGLSSSAVARYIMVDLEPIEYTTNPLFGRSMGGIFQAIEELIMERHRDWDEECQSAYERLEGKIIGLIKTQLKDEEKEAGFIESQIGKYARKASVYETEAAKEISKRAVKILVEYHILLEGERSMAAIIEDLAENGCKEQVDEVLENIAKKDYERIISDVTSQISYDIFDVENHGELLDELINSY